VNKFIRQLYQRMATPMTMILQKGDYEYTKKSIVDQKKKNKISFRRSCAFIKISINFALVG